MAYLESEQDMQKVLFIGLSQSGKTSVIQVVFEGINPESTKTNLATGRLKKKKVDFLGKVISVVEVGGQIPFIEESLKTYKESVYSNLGFLIFILDSSLPNLFEKAHFYFERACSNAAEFSKNVKILLFVHKIDLIPKEEITNVVETVREEFKSCGKFKTDIFATSIYDDSVGRVLEQIYSD